MKTISKTLSDNTGTTKKLQGTVSGRMAGTPASKRETPFEKRVDRDKLERVYYNIPVIFNAINKNTQTIMSRDREITGPNADFFREWLDSVGDVGGNQHWEEILEEIIRFQQIYGVAYVEKVRDTNTGQIVDLADIDPKSVDYAKTDRIGDKIALDEFGNPKGFVQQLPRHLGGIEQVYEPPEDVTTAPAEVFIPDENVAQFKMFTVGEGFYPVGLIEPTFQDAERAQQLKNDYGDKAHTGILPRTVASVGDETHEPNPEQVSEFLEHLRNAESSTEFAHPYYHEIDVLEADNPTAILEFFDNLNSQMVTSMGTPDAFATGSGGDVNRATLQAQDKMFQISLGDLVDRTVRTIEKEIFEPIAEQQGFDDIPTIEWDTNIKISEKTLSKEQKARLRKELIESEE